MASSTWWFAIILKLSIQFPVRFSRISLSCTDRSKQNNFPKPCKKIMQQEILMLGYRKLYQSNSTIFVGIVVRFSVNTIFHSVFLCVKREMAILFLGSVNVLFCFFLFCKRWISPLLYHPLCKNFKKVVTLSQNYS